MKRNIFNFLLVITIFLAALLGCNKSTLDNYGENVIKYQNYFSIKTGDVRLYRLDSTVATNFGTALVVHSYLLKDSVGSLSVGADGDSTYNILRYTTDTLNTQPWKFAITYRIVVKTNTLELIDQNNLRFIELSNPVVLNDDWKGNRYFLSPNSSISSDSSLALYLGWNYQYTSVGEPFSNNYGSFENTISVNQVDILYGNQGAFDQSQYQEKIYSQEVYAEGKGLVYKEFLYYTYQQNSNNPSAFGNYDENSYGVKMTLLN